MEQKTFRDYNNCNKEVKECYKKQREKQNFNFSYYLVSKYCKFERKDTFWNLFNKLKIKDKSDPDLNLENSHHLFQTAEGIRKDNLPEWMQIVGLIHDLGKIIYLFGEDKDGTTEKEQWGLVGDTFITGCKIPDSIILPEYNKLNSDNNKYDKIGLYKENIGLENTLCCFGHDEYLYRMLKYNNINLPEEAYYMIRYHSLYLWHEQNEYSYFENEKDKKMKKWVKLFNKYDLYTKDNSIKDWKKVLSYYDNLVKKYFPKYLYY